MTSLAPTEDARFTRLLLACGAAAGPVYVLVGLIQVLMREGFDVRRHALSLLSNGDFGWIQTTNFLVSGALVLAGALGIRRALAPGRAGTWGPILLALYGVGLIGAGVYPADPAVAFLLARRRRPRPSAPQASCTSCSAASGSTR